MKEKTMEEELRQLREIERAARRCREAQRAYWTCRDHSRRSELLAAARRAEAALDLALRQMSLPLD